MSTITIYDNCQAGAWTSRIAPDVNPVPADQYLSYVTASGLVVLNASSQENGGGLVSSNFTVPANTKYFGMDITYLISSADFPHLSRNEMDLKITVVSGSTTPLPNQANGSAQQNASRNWMWQLDPTGTGWVDSGYDPGPPKIDVQNLMQFRFWTDGTHWSVTGLSANGDTPFVPGSQFQNIGMIITNWGTGLHPQLQMECQATPWFLRQTYTRVRIMASDAPLPWNLGF